MSNPYLLELPAVVSFSGGRTSGYMLRKILDAHGGQPEGLEVCFQNTGLEHAATYDFVREVTERWGVRVTWLEYCVDDEDKHDYKEVGFDSASRKGEPFTALIKKKKYLPNPVARICTVNLKLRTLDRYLKSMTDFEDGYTNAVGLRYDEPRRALRIKADNSREDVVVPLYQAKVTEEDVLAFWQEQDFDLKLPLTGNMAGNCVGCYLKGRGKLEHLMVEMPEHFEWWAKAEKLVQTTAKKGASFRSDRPSYKAMMETARTQGQLFPIDGEDTVPCLCTD
jgi:3'-phosphoadenosine 5'-phosphosulfate sulfotransferase (PAPS reductase)/FAD synthetase